MSDFDTDTLTDDWNNVLASGGPLSFTCNGVTASGIWAAQYNQLTEAEEQVDLVLVRFPNIFDGRFEKKEILEMFMIDFG